MVDILLTNDDGYFAPGLLALLHELSKQFSVVTVAPLTEQSWIGKAISKKRELCVKKVKVRGFEMFAVNGTPADCIQIGLYNLLKTKPKLIVSGINNGANAGHGRILSSGTIGAAIEASLNEVQSIASSLYIPEGKQDKKNLSPQVFSVSAKITARVASLLIEEKFDKSIDVVSLNIPLHPRSEYVITKPFRESYGQLFNRVGDVYCHNAPAFKRSDRKEGTDIKALHERKISITPISLELASKESMNKLKKMLKGKKIF